MERLRGEKFPGHRLQAFHFSDSLLQPIQHPIKIARGRNGGLSLPDGYHLFKKMYMTPVQALALHRALLYVPDEIKKILETILTDFAW